MRSRHLLMGRLYETEDLQPDERGFTATIRLNRDDEVFRGHFPDNPVLPGVCTVQIIKELLSETLAKEVLLRRAPSIKYLSFIDPVANNRIQFDLQVVQSEGAKLFCQAKVHAGPFAFCSFKGEFLVQEKDPGTEG